MTKYMVRVYVTTRSEYCKEFDAENPQDAEAQAKLELDYDQAPLPQAGWEKEDEQRQLKFAWL